MRYIICYDICSERRRRRVSACLDGYGDRIQKSVFEAVLDTDLFALCMSELAELVDPVEDSLAAYAVCGACDDRRVYLGVAEGCDIGAETVFIA